MGRLRSVDPPRVGSACGCRSVGRSGSGGAGLGTPVEELERGLVGWISRVFFSLFFP